MVVDGSGERVEGRDGAVVGAAVGAIVPRSERSVAAEASVAGADRTGAASFGPAPPGAALFGAVLPSEAGAIDSSRIARRERSLNTGPAEVDPVSPWAVSKIITVIDTCGRSTGK